MEGKVAVLGGSDFVMPFSTLGMDTFPVEAQKVQVSDAADKILGQKYGLVVVAENIATFAEEQFNAVQDKAMPCVVVVPFTTESEGFALKSLGKLLRMATGIDILQI